jgi:diacylglycerol kinase
LNLFSHMLKKHTISFKYAFEGLVWALKTQPNYRVHLFCSFIALVLGMWLHISHEEFLIVLVLIMVGLVIETVNTAIEATTDAISTEHRHDIKIAKDVSAAAMLIFAVGSLVIAYAIYMPRIMSIIK